MNALRRLLAIIAAPTDGDSYEWAVIGLGHVMLGAALQGLLGVTAAAARLALAALYWVAKERGDLRRGGALRDGLVDTALVGVGCFYAGPRHWPVMAMAAICFSAFIKERKRG